MSVKGYFTEALSSDIADIIGILQKWGCCTRCIYRFLGSKDPDTYKKPIEKLQDALSTYVPDEAKPQESVCEANGDHNVDLAGVSTPAANDSSTVCICCLGILQHQFSSDVFHDKIHKKVVEEHYEFSTFFVSVMLPVPLILREYSIWILLKELKPAIYHEAAKQEVVTVKEAWKWSNTDSLADKLGVPFDNRSPFEIALNFEHRDAMSECNFLLDLFPKDFRKRKHTRHGWELFTKVNVTKALNDMSEARFKKNYSCPARRRAEPCECNPLSCAHEAIYLAGRYNKYSRTLSQTPWILGDTRKTDTSIEELICNRIKEVIRPSECRFSSSGREDVDVKTLGNGRPFLVELMNPHRATLTRSELKQLQLDINSGTKDIAIRDLQMVAKEETSKLKEGEMEKTKSYSALCWTEKKFTEEDVQKISSLRDLKLMQKTPIRVLHRRPLAVRERVVHSLGAKSVNEHHFMLYLSTEAGTYIKEFVHGDFGRTTPSLGELLGAPCDILELNVESVELDWPPKTDDY